MLKSEALELLNNTFFFYKFIIEHLPLNTLQTIFLNYNTSKGIIFEICNNETARYEYLVIYFLKNKIF